MTEVLSDTITGIRVVKAFDQETREIARFADRNDAVTDEANRVHRMWTAFWPLLMLGVYATTVLVWALAVPRLLGDGAALSTGTFVSFLLYATMFTAPIEVIGQMARTVNRATSSAHRVFEVLDTETDVRDAPEPVRLEPVQGRVTFDNVRLDTGHYRRQIGIVLQDPHLFHATVLENIRYGRPDAPLDRGGGPCSRSRTGSPPCAAPRACS